MKSLKKLICDRAQLQKWNLSLEQKKPAYKVWVDFGSEIGIKQTSAQVTGDK